MSNGFFHQRASAQTACPTVRCSPLAVLQEGALPMIPSFTSETGLSGHISTFRYQANVDFDLWVFREEAGDSLAEGHCVLTRFSFGFVDGQYIRGAIGEDLDFTDVWAVVANIGCCVVCCHHESGRLIWMWKVSVTGLRTVVPYLD
jgi:hypothetical protein